MFTPGTCPSCSKLLPAVADASGLCEECLRSTDRTAPTAPDLLPTVSAAIAANAGTVTFFPSGGTHSVPTDAPDPVVVSARMTRLRNGGWLDVRRCGGGGMGELFAGFDPGLQQQVVAKFIRRDAVSDSTRDRFRVEAATLARLVHKNVARLFAYSEGDDPYLVMEYVDGGTLSELIRGGALPAREAAAILEGVARGVAVAHANGVVHRDLKPSNVLLDRSGSVVVPKVTDFGMAKDADAVEPLTGSNAVLGTPEFMSPEQAARRSASCDARSDVWGLTATLYTAVTGQPPYTRDLLNPPVLTDPLTPPTAHTPDLPADLAAVIAMGLEKHPNDRYQTADEFADDLNRFLAGEPVHARRRAWPVRAWRRARRVSTGTAVAVLFAVVALTAVGAMYFGRALTPEEKMERMMAELAAGKTITVIGETGLPVWHENVIGHAVVDLPEKLRGATGVTAFGRAVVQVTPAIPLPSYQVEVELEDVDCISTPGPGVPHHEFGLIVASSKYATPDGPTICQGFEFSYHDLDRATAFGGRPPPSALKVDYIVYPSDQPSNRGAEGLTSKQFPPSRVPPARGAWRKLLVRVTPGGMEAFFETTPRPANGATNAPLALTALRRLAASELTEHVQEYQKGLAAPLNLQAPTPQAWRSQGAIAITCDSATVGVRNLKILPLTE